MTKNAYRLCLGLFKQDAAGSVLGSLPEEFASKKWNLASIIPTGYEFTNFQSGDTTVETVEVNTITALSKAKKFESGSITPPTFTFANMVPADCKSIVATLDALTGIDDPFQTLLCAGVFNSESSGTRTYDVFMAATAILTTDGGRTAEAKAAFTGSLGLQACHIPIIGAENCSATMTWNTSTNVISLVPSVSGGH